MGMQKLFQQSLKIHGKQGMCLKTFYLKNEKEKTFFKFYQPIAYLLCGSSVVLTYILVDMLLKRLLYTYKKKHFF